MVWCPTHDKNSVLDKFDTDGKMLCRKCHPEAYKASDVYIDEKAEAVKEDLLKLNSNLEILIDLHKQKIEEMNDPSFAKVLEITFDNLPKQAQVLATPDPQNTPDNLVDKSGEDQIGSAATKLNDEFIECLANGNFECIFNL